MANEVTTVVILQVNNGTLQVPQIGTQVQRDQTTARAGSPGVVDLGTTPETISFGDCVPGEVYVRNLDSSYEAHIGLSYGAGVFVPYLLLKAGKQNLLYLDTGVTVQAYASASPCRVMFFSVNE